MTHEKMMDALTKINELAADVSFHLLFRGLESRAVAQICDISADVLEALEQQEGERLLH